ncbi:quinone-dependent dihydroorotate dehydrogenase [Paenibacillus pinihumi]|uniref:quinone-dependent dihydroorotate dehydrogenase n=1 Tax=Paenibacillus pinihumi TaxID=669462 RepID=UPI0003FD728F|nr:quinone-dependent dihydroorotate dehydrogenase [Paenibacillus pinihumi]
MLYRKIAKPFLFRMDPENAHHLIINGMSTASKIPGVKPLLRSIWGVKESEKLKSELFGLTFAHPVGLAAGLDKNAHAVEGFSNIGLAFIEVGTVTPKGQEGNEKPRMFRLPPDQALINRMGFNNEGVEAMAERLKRLPSRQIPLAVNIGKNKVTPNEAAHEDYQKCIRSLYAYGDFFVVNISSPNTPDLRALQHGDELKTLLAAVSEEMQAQAGKTSASAPVKPFLVKIAPDMTEEQLEYTVHTIQGSGAAGIIATNTTISRAGLSHPNSKETGGLSGVPVRERSTEVIRSVYRMTGGKLPIIGSGGIFTAQDAYEKIRAGASLVEIYSGMIYEGPNLLKEINHGLLQLLERDGLSHITEAIGADHR